MAKSWNIYVTKSTTENNDVKRKHCLRNMFNKCRRHGYASKTFRRGGGDREEGRLVDGRLRLLEDTTIVSTISTPSTWDDDPLKHVVCREPFGESAGADRRRSPAFAALASRVFTTRFDVEPPLPLTARRVFPVQVGDLAVSSFQSAWRVDCIFYLNELVLRSNVWYILISTWTAGGLWSGIFYNPNGKWNFETLHGLLKALRSIVCPMNGKSSLYHKPTRSTRRRVPYKSKQICTNSLRIIFILQNKNVVKIPVRVI